MAAQEQNLSPETANTTSKLVWEAKVEAREKKMPPLNIANIIADLSDLNVADPIPALHLVTANKTLGQVRRRSKPSFISTPSAASYFPSTPSAGNTRRSTPRQSSSESAVSTPGSGPLSPTILRRPGAGKGIAGPKTGDWEALNTTPPTGAGTAAIEPAMDPDMLRARMLVELYEIRQTGRQSEIKDLEKTKEKVLEIEGEYKRIFTALKS